MDSQIGQEQSFGGHSLLGKAVFTSRYEKDLQTAKAVREQIANKELPKTNLRMISAKWVDLYFSWIDSLLISPNDASGDSNMSEEVQKPGPISNFDLVDLSEKYEKKFAEIKNVKDPKEWCFEFIDWGQMTLKKGLGNGKDYYFISHANWMKLFSGFGGAPEIPFFVYTVESSIEKADGETITAKERLVDFQPITVKAYMAHQGGSDFQPDQQFSLMVSKHLTVHQLSQFIGQIRKDCTHQLGLYVIRPQSPVATGHCVIHEAPQKSCTLESCGIVDRQQIVLLQKSEAEVELSSNPGKVHQFYNSVAKFFNIARDEYAHILPEIPISQSVEVPFSSPRASQTKQDAIPLGMSSSYQKPQSNIPEEYKHDPELYQAIQASLQEGVATFGQGNNEDLYHVQDNQMYDGAESASTEKAYFDDKINEQPKIEQSAFNQNAQGGARRPQKTKAEHAKELRVTKVSEFYKKRELAKQKLQGSKEVSLVQLKSGQMHAQQLGLPYRKYTDIHNSLGKLKQNFDLIMSGKMSLAEHQQMHAECEASQKALIFQQYK